MIGWRALLLQARKKAQAWQDRIEGFVSKSQEEGLGLARQDECFVTKSQEEAQAWRDRMRALLPKAISSKQYQVSPCKMEDFVSKARQNRELGLARQDGGLGCRARQNRELGLARQDGGLGCRAKQNRGLSYLVRHYEVQVFFTKQHEGQSDKRSKAV